MIRKIRAYFSLLVTWHRMLLTQRRDGQRRRALGLPEFPPPDEVLSAPYVFVLSTGRCGTAYLTEVLSRSPGLSVRHTPKPELEYVSSLVHRTRPTPEALDLATLAARFELFVEAYRAGRTYVETNNRITFFAPALAHLLPNARFIHVVRHPGDFVRSGMRRGYYAPGVVQHQRLTPPDFPEWSSYSEVEKICWEWNEINSFIEHFKESVAADRVLTIRSEAMFREPDAMLAVLDFLGTGEDEELVTAITEGQFKPVNVQSKGSYPKYEQWPEADKVALRQIATLAPNYGYEV